MKEQTANKQPEQTVETAEESVRIDALPDAELEHTAGGLAPKSIFNIRSSKDAEHL